MNRCGMIVGLLCAGLSLFAQGSGPQGRLVGSGTRINQTTAPLLVADFGDGRFVAAGLAQSSHGPAVVRVSDGFPKLVTAGTRMRALKQTGSYEDVGNIGLEHGVGFWVGGAGGGTTRIISFFSGSINWGGSGLKPVPVDPIIGGGGTVNPYRHISDKRPETAHIEWNGGMIPEAQPQVR